MIVTLDNMSGQSFERLVRALAFKVFGASGCVFSSGPDGGRDMTVEGKIDAYSSKGWEGYVVIQSKYREREGSRGQTDAQWLKSQLETEKAAYLDPDSGRRVPDYYLIVTNVSLSGADGKGNNAQKRRVGGYTSVYAALDDWKDDIGIKDFDIWPSDKIIDLLSNNIDVRRSFAAWITPSDILDQVMQWMGGRADDFDTNMRRSLISALRRREFAELKDAGSVADQSVRTGQVFIDVPYEISGRSRRRLGQAENIVSKLVERSKDRYGPSIATDPGESLKTNSNRIVILGGPGQGKSTLSTFLAQIFRSSILLTDVIAMRDDTVRLVAPEIIKRAADQGIANNIPRRYPVFVSLPLYADQISIAKSERRRPPSLLHYITDETTDSADSEISKEDLRNWLIEYPWLLILDGLDEVPPSGERSAVIDSINGIVSEVAQLGADVLFVLTTRPQGYNNDLDKDLWEHWELIDLPVERALAYTTALAVAKYSDDRPRRERIGRALQAASVASTTSRLLVTPLQATILFLIVDTGGSAPTARWDLFNEYFEVLKRREKAKPGEIGKAIERNWAHLGPIHQAIGLILQAKSEVEGGAGSKMTIEDVNSVLTSHFASLGFSGTALIERVADLYKLALHRLVLLAAKDEGFVQFDVRSLQEFMAASALTAGETADVENRLEALAGLAHWRHVWLIAASRCFADDAYTYRRLSVIALPRALETNDLDRAVENGARLALELFRDGIGVEHPTARIILAKHAIEGLRYGPGYVDEGVSELWEDGAEAVVQEGLIAVLRSGNAVASLGAWALIWKLDAARVDTAITAFWPRSGELALRTLRAVGRPPASAVLSDVVRASISDMNAADVARYLVSDDDHSLSGWTRFVTGVPAQQGNQISRGWVVLPSACGSYLTVKERTLSGGAVSRLAKQNVWNEAAWPVILSISNFEDAPAKASLSAALLAIRQHPNLEEALTLGSMSSWPLASLLSTVLTNADLESVAQGVENDLFGDYEDWAAAELRWQAHGITTDDLLHSGEIYPFSKEIGTLGAPVLKSLSVSMGSEDSSQFFRPILSVFHAVSSKKLKENIAWIIGFATVGLGAGEISDPDTAKDVLRSVIYADKRLYHRIIGGFSPTLWKDTEFCELIALASRKGFYGHRENLKVDLEAIVSAAYEYRITELYTLALVSVLTGTISKSAFRMALADTIRVPWDAKGSDLCGIHALNALIGKPTVCAEELADMFMEWRQSDEESITSLMSNFMTSEILDVDYAIKFGSRIHHVSGTDDWFDSNMKDTIKAVLDRRKSDLTERSVWVESMKLPSYQYDSVKWK
jgi:hypothetical protein